VATGVSTARAPQPATVVEKRRIILLFAAILIATAASFVLLFVISGHYVFDTTQTGITTFAGAAGFAALGIFCFTLGLRHAVDPDHLAAIDNTTRKLMQEERPRPLTVGTWFSLGHSTVVVAMVIALIFATRFISQRVPQFQSIGGVVGTLVSGTFLFVIGLVNLVIVLEVYRIFQRARAGQVNEDELQAQLAKRGFMNRYFHRLFSVVRKPRDIYPIGVLFGLGFDTATEIILISSVVVLSAASTAPIYVLLVLPLLFTCGMVLVDTANGVTMSYAYGWAFQRPLRRIYFNLTVTIISVVVAFGIGAWEILAIIGSELQLTGPFWSAITSVDAESLGLAVAGIFLGTWGIASLVYWYKGYDKLVIGDSASSPARPNG
jgi:nickel/cobalt transporter (NiCoT) family protein